jgi:hypothetical protein
MEVNEFERAVQVLVDAGLLKDDSVVLEAERARDEG